MYFQGLQLGRAFVTFRRTHQPPPKHKMANPICFFDMTIGGEPAGRIEMTLRADVTPKTAGTFRVTPVPFVIEE